MLKKESEVVPISVLQANATDVTFMFLSTNGIFFNTRCDDPWYAAFNPMPVNDNSIKPVYFAEEPVRVLGCTERYQFCNPNPNFKMDSSCTPLTGIFTATAAADALWRTNEQRKIFNISSNAILSDADGLYEMVSVTGISSLIARHSLFVGVQDQLPNNQWQLEVENWYGATLADLQRTTVEYVTGPNDPVIFRYLQRPQTGEEHLMCRSLVSSFSFQSRFF